MSAAKKASIKALVRSAYRLLRYKNQRHKYWREIRIRKMQDLLLKSTFDRHSKKLIVFLVPGSDWATGKDKISGGTMSVVSFCEETEATQPVATVLCTMNEEHLLLKHQMFDNHSIVYRFSQLPEFFTEAEELLIHIPEFMASRFLQGLSSEEMIWIRQQKKLHLNIMNQNINLMPGPELLDSYKAISSNLTITTAHQQYSNAHYRKLYGVPIHKLSVWISPGNYSFRSWADKENLLLVSPDERPEKAAILAKLERIPGLTVQVIQNLTYTEYKALIARAKWSLTFGEGLDGYLIEPVFSGAIAFAVYNEHFFTPDFKGLPTIYPDYASLEEQLAGQIAALDEAEAFAICQQQLFDICASHYSYKQYQKNIADFYQGKYSHA